ncbi:MAG: helix-turn-helix domain-containing protein [Synergistaceae bacterium]|nr:helix-turn-helix domain-containing protein [Synergistaceae bacterium]MBQ8693428.1 helix-turn-helix domain-containing protein [Synergistaceae bacterium]
MAELKERRYLRAREVAERLGVSITTVYRLIQQGQFIEGAKFGGSRRWDVQAVDAWATEQAAQLKS